MATYDDIVSRIADDMVRGDINSQIGVGLNRAIQHYQSQRTWFNEASATFQTITAQQSYSTADGIPTDILKIDVIKIVFATNDEFPLRQQSFQYVQDVNRSPTTFTGQPTNYARYSGKIWFDVTPDDAYEVKLHYIKEYSDIASTQSNDWTTESGALELVEARTGWWVASRILRDDTMAARYKVEENEAYKSFNERCLRETRAGHVKPRL